MSDISRREFTKLLTAAGIAAGLPGRAAASDSQTKPEELMVGIQAGAVSFVDEEVGPLLDRFQQQVGINTLFVATFSYGNGIAGRQVKGHPLPDHGKQEYDTTFYGGNYARAREQYYSRTSLRKIQAPDHGAFDVLEAVLPQAKARGMKTFTWSEDFFRRDLEGIEPLQEVTLSGKKASTLCFNNPGVQAFWQALHEDYLRSYPIDGIMWGSERQGPFNYAIGALHGGARQNPFEVACFCQHCEAAAKARGIDVQRAREGYTKLAELVRNSRASIRPTDGYFVSYWRLLVKYPEILAWEKLWNDGQKSTYRNIYRLAKSIRPEIVVGWHIWHNNSFSPFYRAEQDYSDFREYSDFLKVVMYNNCAGPRLANYVDSVGRTIFADLSPEAVLKLTYEDLNYSEAMLNEIPQRGLSADYVARESRRALAGVQGAVKIWPGIDIDVPTGEEQKQTKPEDVRQAVSAALKAGAQGVILSRKYSEMRLANLYAAGEALRTWKKA